MLAILTILSTILSCIYSYGCYGYGFNNYISESTRFKIEQLLWEVAFVADDITLELRTAEDGAAFLEDALTDDFEYERMPLVPVPINKENFIGFLAFGLSFRGWHYLVGTPPLYTDISHNQIRLRINDFVVSPQEIDDTDVCRQDFTGEAVFFTFRRQGWKWKISRIENNIAHNQRVINSTFDCPTSPAPAAKRISHSISDNKFVDGVKTIPGSSTGAGYVSKTSVLMIGMFALNICFFMLIAIKLFCNRKSNSTRTKKYNQIANFSSESEMEA